MTEETAIVEPSLKVAWTVGGTVAFILSGVGAPGAVCEGVRQDKAQRS